MTSTTQAVPFTMEPPTSVWYRGRVCWSPSVEYLVEYVMWKHGEPIAARHLNMRLADFHKTNFSASYLGQVLRQLGRQQRVHKLARGMYVHAQFVGAVRAQMYREQREMDAARQRGIDQKKLAYILG